MCSLGGQRGSHSQLMDFEVVLLGHQGRVEWSRQNMAEDTSWGGGVKMIPQRWHHSYDDSWDTAFFIAFMRRHTCMETHAVSCGPGCGNSWETWTALPFWTSLVVLHVCRFRAISWKHMNTHIFLRIKLYFTIYYWIQFLEQASILRES